MLLKSVGNIIIWILTYCMMLTAASNEGNPAQGDSVWSLDPFLGAYDMDMLTQTNMLQFSGGILGVPEDVILAGERIVFNKTEDGKKYQQFVLRNDSNYSVHTTFILGESGNVPFPQDMFLDYSYTMLEETLLLCNFSFFLGTHTAQFEIIMVFNPDGSGFHDVINVSSPKPLEAQAQFYRAKDAQDEPNPVPSRTEL